MIKRILVSTIFGWWLLISAAPAFAGEVIDGVIATVNHKPIEASFPAESLRLIIRLPLVVTETAERFDVLATTTGGGIAGQAGALRLGIARALLDYDAELRAALRKAGLLTRDPRAKERKKPGLVKARKRKQWSKR